MTAKAVFPRGMNLADDFFLFSDEVRPVLLKPFDPVLPHFNDFFLLKFSGNAEAGYSINVGIKVFLTCEMAVFVPKDGDDFFLVGFDLCELAISDKEGVGSCLHCDKDNNG